MPQSATVVTTTTLEPGNMIILCDIDLLECVRIWHIMLNLMFELYACDIAITIVCRATIMVSKHLCITC